MVSIDRKACLFHRKCPVVCYWKRPMTVMNCLPATGDSGLHTGIGHGLQVRLLHKLRNMLLPSYKISALKNKDSCNQAMSFYWWIERNAKSHASNPLLGGTATDGRLVRAHRRHLPAGTHRHDSYTGRPRIWTKH